MKIEIVSKDIYYNSVKNMLFVYNSVGFNELNKAKVERLDYLLIKKDKSPRFGLCLGISNGIASCPYSAPFGVINSIKNNSAMLYLDEAIEALDDYANENKLSMLKFVLPPLFYDEEDITGWINTFYRKGYIINNIDINYSLSLKKMYATNYTELIHHNARKNLKIALSSDLKLIRCIDEKSIMSAYEIIKENRNAKGYPLRMTLQQVLETIKIVKYDVFIVVKGDEEIAAALVYHVNDKIAQVIYWGDRPGFGNVKPINYLAYELIQYYGEKGFDYLDIGPSTEDSQPNYGLCDFKESIGCERSCKLTFHKEFEVQ